MENDVNTPPVVTETGVVEAATTESETAQVATEQGVQQVADGQPAAAAAPADQTVETDKGPVPYDRFAEVNSAKTALQAENDQLKEHLKLTANQQPAQVQPQAAQPVAESLTLQVMKSMGLDPEGILTAQESAQVNDKVMGIMVQQISSQNQSQAFIASKTDFAQVVGQKDPASGQFIYAPPLARVLNANPGLIAALQGAGEGANALAYQLGANDPTYQAQVAQAAIPAPLRAAETAEAVVKAANSMTSVSAAGGAGVIDKAAQIRAMSNEQFIEYKNSIIAQGGIAV